MLFRSLYGAAKEQMQTVKVQKVAAGKGDAVGADGQNGDGREGDDTETNGEGKSGGNDGDAKPGCGDMNGTKPVAETDIANEKAMKALNAKKPENDKFEPVHVTYTALPDRVVDTMVVSAKTFTEAGMKQDRKSTRLNSSH